MWSDGEPIDPSPTIDQAVNGGFPWLEIQCARCKTPSDVDLAAMKHPPTTFVHDLASRLRCRKCAKAGRRPAACYNWLGSRAILEPKMCNLYYADLWSMPTIGSERAGGGDRCVGVGIITVPPEMREACRRLKTTRSGYRWSCRGQCAFFDSHTTQLATSSGDLRSTT
jgi:hypothetical protein